MTSRAVLRHLANVLVLALSEAAVVLGLAAVLAGPAAAQNRDDRFPWLAPRGRGRRRGLVRWRRMVGQSERAALGARRREQLESATASEEARRCLGAAHLGGGARRLDGRLARLRPRAGRRRVA